MRALPRSSTLAAHFPHRCVRMKNGRVVCGTPNGLRVDMGTVGVPVMRRAYGNLSSSRVLRVR